MRASFDGLFHRAKTILHQDPFSGHLFVFINKARTACKVLYYDGTGLVVISKRLEKGRFTQINRLHAAEIILTHAEFALFFEGAQLDKRFVESPPNIFRQATPSEKNSSAPVI